MESVGGVAFSREQQITCPSQTQRWVQINWVHQGGEARVSGADDGEHCSSCLDRRRGSVG